MRLSSKGHYGLRAMIDLARAYDKGPVALSEIATREGLSLRYLEQLVGQLRKAGLVRATRGVHGGYALQREPSAVTVGDVVRVLEGPIVVVECASEIAQPGCCTRQPDCASRGVWERVRDSVALVLDSTTLADLCQRNPESIGITKGEE